MIVILVGFNGLLVLARDLSLWRLKYSYNSIFAMDLIKIPNAFFTLV